MSIVSELKNFLMRGNVVDLAVGVVIGGAFGKIVTGFVDDILMPPIGFLTGGLDFSAQKLVLKAADPATKAAETAISYGAFLNTVIQFVIISTVIFFIVKMMNKLSPAVEPEPAPGPSTNDLLGDILTELRKKD